MNFPSVDIQGSILSADLLGMIRSEQAKFQLGKDFDKSYTNAKLKDEISLAWQDAKGQWTIFQNKLKRVTEGETAATVTRNFWVVPLLSNLGYDFQYLKAAEELNGKSFWINNRDNTIGGFPIFIAGFNESLDKRPENKNLRVSPHALVQEYLNYSEHLYGIVTNGKQLRLLRDASRLTRLSYIEFDLQKIMEEDLYPDFVILYRLLHKSRMPQQQDGSPESIIEKYHQEGLASGATIRNKLGAAVKDSIKSIANGFINHPDNIKLRKAVSSGQLEVDEYYRQLLRIIYRLLFLFVIEERNLVYADNKDPQNKRFNHIYFNFYSLLKLRKLAKELPPPEAARYYDLWLGVISTFALFEDARIGKKMGIMSLQGELFNYNAIASDFYDLHKCRLSNDLILKVIKALCYFENDQGVLVAVNYGGLDVEEFGSVYEGLLELKLKIESIPGTDTYSCSFDGSAERSTSGSHYTPEELVQPLIKHSLEYLIEDRVKLYREKKASKDATVKELLRLKICDVACGSGHILLSAARRIALEVARVQNDEDQPNPVATRKALRDVIRNCIYGVDKNPLAVELCKVAFWLEAHNPGEPLNFLDHRIKCGDAIIGLAHKEELKNGIADEAFKTLPGDDKETIGLFAKRNKEERKTRSQASFDFEGAVNQEIEDVYEAFEQWSVLPESNTEESELKAKAHNKLSNSGALKRLKMLADIQVGQFFIPKIQANKEKLVTDASYFRYLKGEKPVPQAVAGEMINLSSRRFFHWFLEFPEVFQRGGFDCVLGNPPFLGGQKLSGTFGSNFLEYIKYQYFPIGAVDLVTYFFRRIYSIIKKFGFQALISTNTIAQGDARKDGLEVILRLNGIINFAIKSMKWPGLAAVDVSLVSISKSKLIKETILNGHKIDYISSFLDDSNDSMPFKLLQNSDKAFMGTVVLGTGFIVEKEDANRLLIKNMEALKPYLIGDDVNSNFLQEAERFIIDFQDWPLEKCSKEFPELFKIVKEKVKTYRLRKGNKMGREKWWLFYRSVLKMYRTIANFQHVLLRSLTSKHHSLTFVKKGQVYDQTNVVFAFESFDRYSILQSSLHYEWITKYSADFGTTGRYNIGLAFETFAFPTNYDKQKLEKIGRQYHEHRKQLLLSLGLGLTKIYNAFHALELQPGISTTALLRLDKKTIEIQYGKEVLNLWTHLQKNTSDCKLEEVIERIIIFRDLHVQMDNAVLEAYAWQDMQLRHDFYDVNSLPEKDRIRYTIHPDARKEVLKRLLEMNHKIHNKEVRAGLYEKKALGKKQTKTKQETQISLLINLDATMKEWSLHDGIYSDHDCAKISGLSINKIRRWFGELSKKNYEGFGDQKTDVTKLKISFHGLIELVVIGALMDAKLKLKNILLARKKLKAITKKEYPFATNNVKQNLKVAGKIITFNLPEGNVDLDGSYQFNLTFINLFFRDIIFDGDIAQRMIPAKGKGKIVIDPKEANGKPAIINKEVPVDAILQFYSGPASLKIIEKQFCLTEDEVLAAIEYGN